MYSKIFVLQRNNVNVFKLKNNVYFCMEERAQISVELIIVLAAVVAVVLLLVTQLQETADKGAKKMDETAEKVFSKIDKI
jgi:hypothetical protein